MHVCTCECAYVHVCTGECVCTCVCMRMYVHMCTCDCAYVCTCECMRVCHVHVTLLKIEFSTYQLIEFSCQCNQSFCFV